MKFIVPIEESLLEKKPRKSNKEGKTKGESKKRKQREEDKTEELILDP